MKKYKVHLIIEEGDDGDYEELTDEAMPLQECDTLREAATFRDTLIDFMQMADNFELVIDHSIPGRTDRDTDGWYAQVPDVAGFIPQKCACCSTMSTKNRSLVTVLDKQYCGPCAWEAVNKKRSESIYPG